jgi:hypothetical protein
VDGFGWTITPASTIENAFALQCDNWQMLVRNEWGSDILDVLDRDGNVQQQLQRRDHMEGPVHNGRPDGKWRYLKSGRVEGVWEFRDGELVDVRSSDGTRDFSTLNYRRLRRGLRPLTEDDFPAHDTLDETQHD